MQVLIEAVAHGKDFVNFVGEANIEYGIGLEALSVHGSKFGARSQQVIYEKPPVLRDRSFQFRQVTFKCHGVIDSRAVIGFWGHVCVLRAAGAKKMVWAFFAPDPWAGKPMIALRCGTAQTPQVAQSTWSCSAAGQTLT